ncbi:hypothetical protein [Mycobacterium ostraviense]|uniref:Uncharacterized protein n=1 Tax=Mycobacterium ostraviense TaxID=2738409 RepID=A0A164BHM5_9MYCO|nr:hypothetical protein [Mycobacterium ostraviense]KZS63499.1 hypothetical protein A4G28_09920 [Mycobacterium ostraviense]UGT92068.1 hypothetical protein LTS72_01010 [Mycobacterium ostraviense]
MALPDTAPAERYQAAFHEALAARAQAAGGAEHIISGDDVDTMMAAARDQDNLVLREARRHCSQIRRDLNRAELTAAAAFATAETRSAEHVTAQLKSLDTELRVNR